MTAQGIGKYPYECRAKDRYPSAMIYHSAEGGWTHSEDPACKLAIEEARLARAVLPLVNACQATAPTLPPHALAKLKTSAALHAQDFNQTPGKLPVGASYSIFDQLAKEDAANPNAGIVQPFPKGRYT